MRCIEMVQSLPILLCLCWLIETWDVLKLGYNSTKVKKIRINRNMRCIEMHNAAEKQDKKYGLIETWDVLKLDLK